MCREKFHRSTGPIGIEVAASCFCFERRGAQARKMGDVFVGVAAGS